MKYFHNIVGRFPDRQGILSVFAIIVVVTYSWTFFTSFYKLPSWLYFLSLSNLVSIYAYSLVMDLFDSVLLLGAVLFVEMTIFFFFGRRNEFQARAISITLLLFVSIILRLTLLNKYGDMEAFVAGEMIWWGIVFVVAFLFGVLLPKIAWLSKALQYIADRAIIFLYIYIPLSFISLVVVVFRNFR